MFAGYANASLISITSGPGLNISFVDNGFDGTLASMQSDTIQVATQGVVQSITLDISLEHTWVGDLVFRLTGPESTTITLLSRPGLFGFDDGTGCCGNAGNATFANLINFDDLAGTSAESWNGSGGSFSPNDPLSAFIGGSMLGNWTLYIGDSESADVGRLNSWTLNIEYQAVPTPNTLSLLIIASLLFVARNKGALRITKE